MKILLLNGSPHVNGCTFTALSEVEKELSANGVETEIIQIGTQPIAGCIACGKCGNSHKCIFSNDAVNETIAKLHSADGIIIGSPVYYAAANGSLTSFLDRVFYAGGDFSYKVGAAVVSARRAGTTATLDQLNKYFTISNMPIVSSQYWNMVHGNSPDEVLQDSEGLQIMRTLGKNTAWLIKCIQAGKEAGILPPTKEEKKMRTNFIR